MSAGASVVTLVVVTLLVGEVSASVFNTWNVSCKTPPHSALALPKEPAINRQPEALFSLAMATSKQTSRGIGPSGSGPRPWTPVRGQQIARHLGSSTRISTSRSGLHMLLPMLQLMCGTAYLKLMLGISRRASQALRVCRTGGRQKIVRGNWFSLFVEAKSPKSLLFAAPVGTRQRARRAPSKVHLRRRPQAHSQTLPAP